MMGVPDCLTIFPVYLFPQCRVQFVQMLLCCVSQLLYSLSHLCYHFPRFRGHFSQGVFLLSAEVFPLAFSVVQTVQVITSSISQTSTWFPVPLQLSLNCPYNFQFLCRCLSIVPTVFNFPLVSSFFAVVIPQLSIQFLVPKCGFQFVGSVLHMRVAVVVSQLSIQFLVPKRGFHFVGSVLHMRAVPPSWMCCRSHRNTFPLLKDVHTWLYSSVV